MITHHDYLCCRIKEYFMIDSSVYRDDIYYYLLTRSVKIDTSSNLGITCYNCIIGCYTYMASYV